MDSPQSSTILVVDDEERIRNYLSEVLRLEGYECRCFSESVAALAYLDEPERAADLMLADIRMPGMNGIDLVRTVKSKSPDLPIILVSGLYELALAVDALAAGADEYLKKPVKPSDVVTAVGKYLQADVRERELAVHEALARFLDSGQADGEGNRGIQQVFAQLSFKRYETLQHSKRVAAYSRLLGERWGLDPRQVDELELGALLHDIGKIGVPRNVLMKPDRLNPEEMRVMRTHAEIGHRILAAFPALAAPGRIVYCHHERFGGGGYPRGLAGEEIPLGARLFSVVDTFDAITSDRPYRAASTIASAREEITRMSGTQFDPKLVEAFLEIPEERLGEIQALFPDEPSWEEEPAASGRRES